MAMNDQALKAMRAAIWLLFVVYCAPLVFVTYSYIVTNQFRESDGVLKAFVGFTLTGDQSLSLVHRALLPLIAGFAPLAFKNPNTTKSSIFLMAMLIFAIALSLFLNATFNSPSIQTNLKTLDLFPLLAPIDDNAPDESLKAAVEASFKSGLAGINSFFNRIQETLGMYLLMIFGLKLAQ